MQKDILNEELELENIKKNIPDATLRAFEEALDKVEQEMNRKKSLAEIFMNYINSENKKNAVVAHSLLLLKPPEGLTKDNILELIKNKDSYEELKNLVAIKTEQNLFYYNDTLFTQRFATVQSLIQSKDILATIASTVRHDCKTYPRPTPLTTFTSFPYFYSKDEVLGAVARMNNIEEYKDIDTVTASNNNICIYSSLHMSKKYAQSLAEWIEVEWRHSQ